MFASYLSENTFGKNFVTAAIITFIVSLAGGILMSLYLYVFKLDKNIIFSMFVATPVYSVYNMIVGVLIFIIMENIKKISFRWE